MSELLWCRNKWDKGKLKARIENWAKEGQSSFSYQDGKCSNCFSFALEPQDVGWVWFGDWETGSGSFSGTAPLVQGQHRAWHTFLTHFHPPSEGGSENSVPDTPCSPGFYFRSLHCKNRCVVFFCLFFFLPPERCFVSDAETALSGHALPKCLAAFRPLLWDSEQVTSLLSFGKSDFPARCTPSHL